MKVQFPFPLAIQLELPERYREDAGFAGRLRFLRQQGFAGVELNVLRPELLSASELAAYLAEHDLRMTMFASGAAARAGGLSLSAQDPEVRRRSVDACLGFIDFAAAMRAGVIIGFLQGAPQPDVEGARERFRQSLGRLAPHARSKGVHLVVEASNRYITSVANSLEGSRRLIEGFPADTVRLLADTHHMNIEETDMLAAVRRHLDLFDSIHFSDNNRLLPGLGAIDFAPLVRVLREGGFRGVVGLEGNVERDFRAEVEKSVAYLRGLRVS